VEQGLGDRYAPVTSWHEKYEESRKKDWKPTQLDVADKPEFDKWITGTDLYNNIKLQVAKENNIPVDKVEDRRLIDGMVSGGDYDYVGAWKDDVTSTISKHDNMPHWSSRSSTGKMLKSPNHPTAWKEYFMGAYGYDPDDIGASTYEEARKFQGPVPRPTERGLADVMKDGR
jgi:hypothetical protein